MDIIIPDKTIKRSDKEIYGIFYDPRRLASFGRPLCFSVGTRSIGKSTGIAIMFLLDWIRGKRQWIYSRRTEDETRLTCKDWFNTASEILAEAGYAEELKGLVYEKGEYKCNDEVCGYTIPMSLEYKYKSKPFNNVWNGVYDEFIPPDGRYIGGRGSMQEVDRVESLFQSVDRGQGRAFRNEFKLYFLGNAYSFYNPLFINHGIDRYIRTDTKTLAPKGAPYVLELTKATAATKEIENSNAYKISSKRTRDFAYRNVTFDGGTAFIEKVEKPGAPVFNIAYMGRKYGIWQNMKGGFMYVANEPNYAPLTIAATTEDHRPNYLMVKTFSKVPYVKQLRECYERGDIRFENGKAKYAIDNYFMMGV